MERHLEVISALLSLFDLQENVRGQLQFIESLSESSVSGSLDEDRLTLIDMQVLLESVIEDACNYVMRFPTFVCTEFDRLSFAFCVDQSYSVWPLHP